MIERLRSHYGFTRTPFGRDLAPGMLFKHTAHAEAAARLTWCISEKAIGMVTGEVGVGKTVALRAALGAIDPSRHSVIYIADPEIGIRGILTQLVLALGGDPKPHLATLIPQAADILAGEAAERGRTPVLVLDEAHLLNHAQLDALRMMTNHELDSRQPFALLLLGQPTLRRMIKLGVLAARVILSFRFDHWVDLRGRVEDMSPTRPRAAMDAGISRVRSLLKSDARSTRRAGFRRAVGRGAPRGRARVACGVADSLRPAGGCGRVRPGGE